MSEYKCAEDLFADIGIQFIDSEEAEAGPGLEQEEDTSASSFSSTQDPGPGLELGAEMREAASLGQGLARQGDTSDYSGVVESDFYKTFVEYRYLTVQQLDITFNA